MFTDAPVLIIYSDWIIGGVNIRSTRCEKHFVTVAIYTRYYLVN